MKSRTLLIGLGLMSSSVFAGGYDVEVNVDYFDDDGVDVIGASGAFYFDQVNTSGTPLAESAFMGRNSNVSLEYIDFDGDVTVTGAFAEFFGDKNNNLYGRIGYINADADVGGSDNAIYGELGYFLSDNWLVSIATTDSDGEDPIILATKYVAKLGGGQFFNVEANYNDESEDFSIKGDYYFTPKTSVGLQLSDNDNFEYGLGLKHFINEQFAVGVNYESYDDGDVTGVSLTARF